jgi:hypothetical protein
MLASRRHISRPKSDHPSRATSTLKHSSNQKGFLTRNENRNMAAAAASNTNVNTETGVQTTRPEHSSDELPSSFFAIAVEGCISCKLKYGNQNDIMLRIARN